MSEPCKILVERTGSSPPAIAVHFPGKTIFLSEDTAQVLGRALQQVGFGEKKQVTVREETGTRPAGID